MCIIHTINSYVLLLSFIYRKGEILHFQCDVGIKRSEKKYLYYMYFNEKSNMYNKLASLFVPHESYAKCRKYFSQ
jgi:hypothetical protein